MVNGCNYGIELIDGHSIGLCF